MDEKKFNDYYARVQELASTRNIPEESAAHAILFNIPVQYIEMVEILEAQDGDLMPELHELEEEDQQEVVSAMLDLGVVFKVYPYITGVARTMSDLHQAVIQLGSVFLLCGKRVPLKKVEDRILHKSRLFDLMTKT